jgi:hypothetical protein
MLHKQNECLLILKWTLMLTAVCILVFAVSLGVATAQTQQSKSAHDAPKTWTVMVGGQAAIEPQEYGPAGAWQFMRFYPENITINVGDKK